MNLVYGGTGSGNIDASAADTMKVAMEKADFYVNETLWNMYLSEENAPYLRKVGGMVSLSAATVSELPWDMYTKDALDSISTYGDAAIVV